MNLDDGGLNFYLTVGDITRVLPTTISREDLFYLQSNPELTSTFTERWVKSISVELSPVLEEMAKILQTSSQNTRFIPKDVLELVTIPYIVVNSPTFVVNGNGLVRIVKSLHLPSVEHFNRHMNGQYVAIYWARHNPEKGVGNAFYVRYSLLTKEEFDFLQKEKEDLQLCSWLPTKMVADRGILVGCIKEQQDLIPWWFINYKKHNKLPVSFIDFGIDDKYKQFCSRNGSLIDCSNMDRRLRGWFRKPFTLLRAPYKQFIWFDVDVEIRANIEVFFDFGKNGRIGLGSDPGQNKTDPQGNRSKFGFRKHLTNDMLVPDSGIISVEHGNSIITSWCLKTLRAPEGYYKGDHEILCIVLKELGKEFNEFPESLYGMRSDLFGNAPTKIVMHWSARPGKEIIRTSIAKHEKLQLEKCGL